MLQGRADPEAPSPEKKLRNGYPARRKPADASTPRSLRDVGLELRGRIDAFLAEDPQTSLLRSVQAQLRLSMGVAEEALRRYRCVTPRSRAPRPAG